MLFEELEVIEDRTEEDDYPPSEVDEYEDSSSEEEDEEQQESGGKVPTAPAGAGVSSTAAVEAIKPYTGQCRLLVKIEPTPLAYFLHLVDDTFLGSICENTNRQAALAAAGEGEGFAPLHLAELKVFLAIALHAKNGVRTLFREEAMSYMPRFHRLFAMSMTEDRFLEILRRLHFSPQPAELTTLAALGNVVEHFNAKMENTYYPGRDLCIYNSVVIWRGGVVCRERVARYFDDKHGVAVDALADPSASGLTLRLRVSPQALELERAGATLGARVVDDLTRGLLDRGHVLYLDPFYCSPGIARRLLARGTLCTGLVEGARRARREGGVVVGPWRSGGRRFSYLTTEFGEAKVEASRTPLAVAAFMRATRRDRRDEELRIFPGAELRLRWPKQVFLLALHALARNACALYRRYSGDSMSFTEFLVKVSVSLLPVDIDDLSDDAADLDDTDADDSRHL